MAFLTWCFQRKYKVCFILQLFPSTPSTFDPGLNPKHADLPFYKDIDCTQEDARLKTKTAELQSQGLVVDSKCLSIDEICELAAGPAVCIVLVDSRFLPHVSLFVSLQPTYVGHFILVVSEPTQSSTEHIYAFFFFSLIIRMSTMKCFSWIQLAVDVSQLLLSMSAGASTFHTVYLFTAQLLKPAHQRCSRSLGINRAQIWMSCASLCHNTRQHLMSGRLTDAAASACTHQCIHSKR